MITIFLAIILARIFERSLFSKGSNNSSANSVAEATRPVVIYRSATDQYLAEHYPNAMR